MHHPRVDLMCATLATTEWNADWSKSNFMYPQQTAPGLHVLVSLVDGCIPMTPINDEHTTTKFRMI
eukprot:m.71636 g.71636  ORF g.71636 m.71636 type:complete len:66 (-) comp12307_c0_seq2:2489-2686(-)